MQAGQSGSAVQGDPISRYVVGVAGLSGEPMGRTQFQKMFFLISREVPSLGNMLDYRPGMFGPYSDVLERSLRNLERDGMMELEAKSGYKLLQLTKRGRDVCADAPCDVEDRVASLLPDYLDLFRDMEHHEMLAYVCLMFPEMTANPMNRPQMQSELKSCVMPLIIKRKITSQRGSELLEIPHSEVMDELKAWI
ncbi:MAG: hypothetical protein MPI95_05885 [Nitrosopumilus sp.]|nr:hypothetical protein [Nitrosopumilus sp.]